MIAPLIILAAGYAAYHNSFHGTFIYDDVHAIQKNPYIRSIWTSFSAPTQSSLAGRPIASLSFALTYALFSSGSPPVDPVGPPPALETRGYHIVNLLIHMLAALALYGVIRRTLRSPRLIAEYGPHATALAALAAVIWIIHPLQTQSVTYIVQRTESLVGLWYLLTMYCAIRAFEKIAFSIWTICAVLCSALGMATKEVMVTAPLAVLLYQVIFFPLSFRHLLIRHWSLYVGLAMTWFILIALMFGGPRSLSVGYSMSDRTLWPFIRSEAGVLLHYLWLSIWPARLCLDYGWPTAEGWKEYVPQGLVILGLLGLTVFASIRRRPIAYLGIWFFLILAPTSSVVPIKDLAFEQRMYLPLASVILLIVFLAYSVLKKIDRTPRTTITLMLVAGVCIPLTVRAIRRNRDYDSALHMWSLTLEQRPNNARATAALGTEYFTQGRIAEALPLYQKAVALLPRDWTYWENLGRAYHKNNDHAKAVESYQRALSINPGAFSSHYDLGVIYFAINKYVEAMQEYQRALQCPGGNDYRAHFNLGNTFMRLKRPREAEFHYQRARQLNPKFDKAIKMLESVRGQSSTG